MKKMINRKISGNPRLLSHIGIAVLTCLALVTIIQWDSGLFKAEFREGDIALRDIYAPYDFDIRGDINVKATEEARKKITGLVLPVFDFKGVAKDSVLKKAQSVMDSVALFKAAQDISEQERDVKLDEIAAAYNLSEALVVSIVNLKDMEEFHKQVKNAIESFMSKGIISVSERASLKDGNVTKIMLKGVIEGAEPERPVTEFFTLEDLKEEVGIFSSSAIRDKKERAVFVDFVNAILSVNVVYNKDETARHMQLAEQKVEPVYNMIEVKKNETILNKGERIGKDHIAKLKGIEQNESSVMKIGGLFGVMILVGLFIVLAVLYIKFYIPRLFAGNKELGLLAIICVLLLLAAKGIVVSPWPSSLVPVAVASMLIAILINSRLAIIATCFLSILAGIISGNILDVTGLSLIGGIVGVFAIRGVRRRSQVMAAGLSVGFANMSYIIAMGLVRALSFDTYITESLFGLANGIMSAIIITGVLPVFESVFKITTDISLLELADLNHPVLKEMVIKAPGTYHHSLVVGNLVEAACEAIGANSLLARVSSYFHDIGKIEKASYFSENQSTENSAHDKLSPTMSSLVITNHVKNGVELAHKYRLNKKIVDIIRQHHGTGLVFYFFKRALEKVTDESIGEQSFRYPGPKPQTREAACVLLADSVEAGSRALDDPTPSRIKGLVRKIINNKFIDGQLDECDLTLKDLERIAEIFTHILTGIFHTRVEYPDEPEKHKQ